MRYVFMHNFRGFTETVLPLRQLTFLVGENSTGKSSFLKVLYLLSRPDFWITPERAIQDYSDLGGFNDIVSARADDRSFFQIGALSSHERGKSGGRKFSFAVLTFRSHEGSPVVSRLLEFSGRRLTKLVFQRKRTKFKTIHLDPELSSDEAAVRFLRRVVLEDRSDTKGFTLFPKDLPPDLPLAVAVAFPHAMEKDKASRQVEYSELIPFSPDVTWIAPIRTKPQRFYDGMRRTFTPEGDHTPFVLRKSLRTKTKSRQFAAKLRAFGESSGLFEAIIPHSFDRNPQSPFEILVKFSGVELNLNNVGYGVSQVLPLIVEFLSRESGRTFAVEQPEVHLHPRAQAALGDFVTELAREREFSFFFETHSDYLIDRCRLNLAQKLTGPTAQVIFFQRIPQGNLATVLRIDSDGRYPSDQPPEFRGFFVREEMNLLEM